MTPCEERGLRAGQWVWNPAATPWLSCGWVKLVSDSGDNHSLFWEPNSKYGDSWVRKVQRLDFSQGIYDEKPSWTPVNARLCGAEEVEECDPYSELERILADAYDQSATGKGHERHSTGQRWEDQPLCANARKYGVGGPFYQIDKKMDESQRLSRDAAIHELRGAIVYLAAAIKVLEEQDE